MTLKGDAKFKRKLTFSRKNNIGSLLNIHVSNQKSENFHFDQILLSKAYKDLVEKIHKSYVSWHWRKVQTLKKNWLLVQKWHEHFHQTTQNSENFTLMGYFCPKNMRFQLKQIQRSYLSCHWTVMQNLNKPWPRCLKNGIINWSLFVKSI